MPRSPTTPRGTARRSASSDRRRASQTANPRRLLRPIEDSNDGEATRIGKFELKPTGNSLRGGPELHSIWWTPEKRIKWETVGYAGCRFTGTNQGYGGLAGLLIGIGVPRLVFDVVAPFGKYVFALSQFNEATETGGRACSPASDLPDWWNRRTELGVNVRR